MTIIGIGGLERDPACSVLLDGRLAAAVEQRKIARRAGPGEVPREAIAESLRLAGVDHRTVETIALARPFGPRSGTEIHLELREMFPLARIVSVEHHTAHAASAYFASPFPSATVLTLDRAGDFRCGARYKAEGAALTLEKELCYPDSVGDLYSRVTEFLGFHANADEHKVQWLSTSGKPDFAGILRSILLREGVGLRADRSWFEDGRAAHGGFNARFYRALGLEDGAPIPEPLRANVAASIQAVVEQLVMEMVGEGENLCLAGGLFQNALLVAALERGGRWKNVFVQPAAGNNGTSLGAAWHAWHAVHQRSERYPMTTLALGPSYGVDEIKQVLENCKLRFSFLATSGDILNAAVNQLSGDRIVAWMQGRAEFGPRALGNRSILASPLDPYSSENLNVYIKRRESFRKFAASVPTELAATYFEVGPNSRYLATVGRVRPEYRKQFESAILGQDFVRVHTVDAGENPLFHKLLHAWGSKTGLPVLYNTSFNLFGDPLVASPRDAVRSFYSSGIDAMIVGNFLLEK
jgi:carbamoyltransferase